MTAAALIPGAIGPVAPIAGAVLLGTLGGLVAGLLPGVNGRVGLLLVTPIALQFGPVAGAVFLVAFHSVVHTSGSIPAILLGAPTSAAEAATVIDGYALTRKGQAARAIGATIGSSLVGGVIGALLLLALAPVALDAVRFIGAPEMATLSILGLVSVAALSGGQLSGGLMVAALGVGIASIGIDAFTGTARFTFGLAGLEDGVSTAALITGLFVVPDLAVARRADPAPPAAATGIPAVWAGFREALAHRWLLLRTSLLGAAVGLAPGLGASVSVWIAYAHARRSAPSPVPYGEGAIAGVIAPEAANNAKEGGALAPALFFGIPSSSGMAILLAAFAALGVEVGPRMLTQTPDFVYLIGATNIAANLLAAPLCLLLVPAMATFAAVRRDAVTVIALAAAAAATLLADPGRGTVAMIAIFAGIGLVLKAAELPRAPLLLGYILAPGIESGGIRAALLHGWGAAQRPGVLVILGVAAAIVLAGRRRAVPVALPAIQAGTRAVPLAIGAIAAALLAMLLLAWRIGGIAALVPGIAAATGLCCCVVLATGHRRRDTPVPPAIDWPDAGLLALFAALLAGLVLVDAAAAIGLFVAAAMIVRARAGPIGAIATALVCGVLVWGLGSLQR